jgi:hypothetical protein
MNTTKSVYNRLFAEDKVELASERVELGLKEDALETVKLFEKSYSTVDNEIFKFYNQLEAAKKQFEGIKGDISNFLSFEGKIKSEQNKILAAGKELGIDVTGAPFYKELSAALFRFGNLKEEVKLSENSYKSIKL